MSDMPERVPRYDLEDVGRAYLTSMEMVRSDEYGDWVKYDDHASRLAALEAERAAVVKRLDKAASDLRVVGGYDNELVGVPAGGVRSIIEDCRAILKEGT